MLSIYQIQLDLISIKHVTSSSLRYHLSCLCCRYKVTLWPNRLVFHNVFVVIDKLVAHNAFGKH